MKNLKNFKINLNEKKPRNSSLKLKNFIDDVFRENDSKELFQKISDILSISKFDIELKAKKILYNQFSYKENKFKNFSSLFNIIYHFFAFFLIFIKTICFKKKLETKKKKLAIFGIETIDEIFKFKKILEYFDNSILVTSRDLEFDNKKKYFHNHTLRNYLKVKYQKGVVYFNYKKNISNNFSFKTIILNERQIILDQNCLKKKFEILLIILSYFILSIKKKFNYLMFINIILFSYIKNYSIFKRYNCDIILIDRIYLSCPIRNALFKKFGGKSSISLQSHLSEDSISFYNQVDIFFTFGKETHSKKILNKFGSQIKDSVPAGSIQIQNYYYNFKNIHHSKKKIDILVLGVNKFNWFYSNKNTQKNYYKFFHLLKNLSKKYKNIKIYIKHHPNNLLDEKEFNIIKNSNIKYLDQETNSYFYIKNSKLFFSFSSTMIQEIYAVKQSSFFVDANNNNENFFLQNLNLNKIKISTFKSLCRMVDLYLIKKQRNQKAYNADICFGSKNTSKIIIKRILKEL